MRATDGDVGAAMMAAGRAQAQRGRKRHGMDQELAAFERSELDTIFRDGFRLASWSQGRDVGEPSSQCVGLHVGGDGREKRPGCETPRRMQGSTRRQHLTLPEVTDETRREGTQHEPSNQRAHTCSSLAASRLLT